MTIDGIDPITAAVPWAGGRAVALWAPAVPATALARLNPTVRVRRDAAQVVAAWAPAVPLLALAQVNLATVLARWGGVPVAPVLLQGRWAGVPVALASLQDPWVGARVALAWDPGMDLDTRGREAILLLRSNRNGLGRVQGVRLFEAQQSKSLTPCSRTTWYGTGR